MPPQGGRKHRSRNSCRLIPLESCSFAEVPSPKPESGDSRSQRKRAELAFGHADYSKDGSKGIGATLAETQAEDLVKFGLIPEFVGRLPMVATLEELDEAALVQILTEPKNSLVKQYGKMFELEDVALDIRPEALSAVARKAMERKTGARGLPLDHGRAVAGRHVRCARPNRRI